RVLLSLSSWFKSVYKEVGRWPYMDSSEVILFHYEPLPAKIPNLDFLNLSLRQFKGPRFEAEDFRVKVTPLNQMASAKGKFKMIQVSDKRLQAQQSIFHD